MTTSGGVATTIANSAVTNAKIANSTIDLTTKVTGILPLANMTQLFQTNAQTATYQVVAADFADCKTIPVASGTFTITLVASGSQPASGQCIHILNYGSGTVTVAASGQNINGVSASQTIAAGSASAPTGLRVVSDGTNYLAQPFVASAGGGGSGYATIDVTGPGGALPGVTALTQRATVNAKYPLVPADNSGNTRTDLDVWLPCDPRRYHCEYDDFDSAPINASYYAGGSGAWNIQGSGGQSLGQVSPSPSGTYGVIRITSGAASGNNSLLSHYFLGQNGALNATTFDLQIRARFLLTTTAQYFIGFGDGNGGATDNNQIGIQYDTVAGDTNYMCVTKSGGTATRTSTGTAADTNFHTFRIRATTAGTILCSVDGGTEVSNSTNVTSTSLVSELGVTTQTAASRSLDVDFWTFVYAISR